MSEPEDAAGRLTCADRRTLEPDNLLDVTQTAYPCSHTSSMMTNLREEGRRASLSCDEWKQRGTYFMGVGIVRGF
jgi:hypothetical protein